MGGYLVDRFGWESIFTINIPIGILIFILAVLAFKPDKKNIYASSRFDIIGLILSMIASILIVYAFAMVTVLNPAQLQLQIRGVKFMVGITG